MSFRRHIPVWLKRRRNPPKKDGTRTISYTLQWRDVNWQERFESLGANISEEEVEATREAFENWLNAEMLDPQDFIEQMAKRNPRGMETLKLTAGDDPRRWPFQQMFGDQVARWDIRFEELVSTLQSRPQDHPETLLQQFQTQYPAEYEVLVDLFESREALLKNVKMLLLFHGGEGVWVALVHHAKEWEWSQEPSRFFEQFRSRYPAQFEAIEKEIPMFEQKFQYASLPPKEIAKRLLEHARGELHIYDDGAPSPGRSIVLPSQIE